MEIESAIESSINYLVSSDAVKSLAANCYWPKWNSPWWHITLLHEMGLANRIPRQAIGKIVESLKASPLTVFPIHPNDAPAGLDLSLGTHCHCALGNIYQALSAAGVSLDEELPWMRSWFLRYQLPDGGLNCDNEAYLKENPPSSIVGTIAPLEAVLYWTDRPFTSEEERFLDRGAQCLIDRKLMFATSNSHNVEEKEDESDWLKLCFPRFYFYDVLRGLSFILRWAERRKRSLPLGAIEGVANSIRTRFPDGEIRLERRCYEGSLTRAQQASGEWKRTEASFFPLLEEVSRIGSVSPYLSALWAEARQLILGEKPIGG